MTVAAILTVVDGESGSRSALITGLATGRVFDAYVEVLHVAVDPESSIPVLGENMSGAAVQQLIESVRAGAARRLDAARQLFDQFCAGTELEVVECDAAPEPGRMTVSWRQVTGREDDQVAGRGRFFDLVVLGRPDQQLSEAFPATFEAALIHSGRPVLVAPPQAGESFGTSVGIAWDGSREAARAVGSALPFMTKARQIGVFTVQEKEQPIGAEELVRYLARHGLTARLHALKPDYRELGEQLLEEAAGQGADLFVMGGYGHSRLREFVLGGVTRTVVKTAKIPVLIVH